MNDKQKLNNLGRKLTPRAFKSSSTSFLDIPEFIYCKNYPRDVKSNRDRATTNQIEKDLGTHSPTQISHESEDEEVLLSKKRDMDHMKSNASHGEEWNDGYPSHKRRCITDLRMGGRPERKEDNRHYFDARYNRNHGLSSSRGKGHLNKDKLYQNHTHGNRQEHLLPIQRDHFFSSHRSRDHHFHSHHGFSIDEFGWDRSITTWRHQEPNNVQTKRELRGGNIYTHGKRTDREMNRHQDGHLNEKYRHHRNNHHQMNIHSVDRHRDSFGNRQISFNSGRLNQPQRTNAISYTTREHRHRYVGPASMRFHNKKSAY